MATQLLPWMASTLLLAIPAFSQNFQNLDFNSAQLAGSPFYTTVPLALPEWNATVGGNPFYNAFYNTIPLDSSYVGAFDANAPSYMPRPLYPYGYGAVLAAGYGGDVSLNQTGLVPADARSIFFWTTGPTGMVGGQHDAGVRFSINGASLATSSVDESEGWTLWSADVSGYAGSLVEIEFSLKSYYGPGNIGAYEYYLDDIAFSTIEVPEPDLAWYLIWSLICAGFWRARG